MRENRLLSLLLTAAMLAAAATFTACSGDKDGTSEKEPDTPDSGEGIKLGEPIGLVYTDFLTETDVIHNADTTELRISKALADKKGITDFVNRPMGIWDQKEHRAYLRRATEQRLEGDRYVLKVVRSSVAEVTHGQEMALNTGIYYNPTRMARRTGLTRASGGNAEADKYIDDNNVIHPAAITVQMKSDAPAEARSLTRASGDGNSATFTIEELYTNPPSGANGWFDWLEDLWDEIVEVTSYDWDDDHTISLISTSAVISKDFKFDCGGESGDTITLRFRCPIDFDLDYTLNIRSHGSIETAFVPIPSYLETYIDGYLEANPQLRIGFSKKVTLPEDKQRITLFQFSGIGFTFMLGPVPLTIDIDPNVYLKFTSELTGNAYVGVQYDIATKFKAGVKYDGGWSGIAEGEKVKDEFSFINPKATLRYYGGVGVFFGIDVIIEKVAGPSFDIGPQVTLDANLSYQLFDDHVDASIEAHAGVGGEAGAKIKIFGFNVAEWESTFDIGPQWTIFQYPDDGSGSSGSYDPDKGSGSKVTGSTVNLGDVDIPFEAQDGQTLTGTLGSTVKVSIADGATVTLNNATINGWYNNDDCPNPWAGITCAGDATIILQGNNNIKGFNGRYPGIHVPEGHTLTIKGNGSLTASSSGYGAGIGGGSGISCGNIIITDGNINATGDDGAAGIGGGMRGGHCGNITIRGGTVDATGGEGAAAIGSGYWSSRCGNITITDEVTKVTATKGKDAPNSIGAGDDSWCGTVTIGGHKGAISTSPFTYPFPFTGDLSWLARDYEAKNGDVLTGTLGSKVRITVPDGVTLTLDGATINGEDDPNCPWAGISCTGNATIVLKGSNTVRGWAKNHPGIYIAPGKTLTIRGDGSLNASSHDYGAGIGGGYELACGNIVVESGTIKATGSAYATGIGGGYNASCGTVTIKGGTVSTTGGSSSAGIGSAYQGSCGNVVIEGGTVNTKGGSHASGIGSGQKGSCGNITITKGITHVTATAGSQCPNSIGEGVDGTCGTVTIGGIVGAVNQTVYDSSVGVIVTGVSLSQTSATLEVGETLKLTATIAPANATNKGVTWSSSNTAVTTVAGGVVTAKAVGTATIKVTTDNGQKTATCTVTVGVPVTGVSLSQTEAKLQFGETLALTATVTPANATIKRVTWSSSDEAVATVNENGVVTAKTEGTATITATTADGAKKATCTVTVTPVLVTGVSLSQTSAAIKVGETLKLTATFVPANATNKGVTWSSSNETIATVADGVVTGKTAGMAAITVTTVDGKKTATCKVSVNDDESDEFLVDLNSLTEDYLAFDGDVLTGTLGKNVKISIANGATVTLRDATINGVNNNAYKWAGINCPGNATIVLEGTNSVRGFYRHYPGIHIAPGKTLTIRGSGTLNASAYGSGAGIGGGFHINCGNIVIEGGTINATGGHMCAGIGGGSVASCGTITITSGVTSVTATKGSNAPYSIGPGNTGTCGTVTIGGKTGAISESPYTYKP